MPLSSLVQLLRERAEDTPDKRAYTFLSGGEETESLTFGQLYVRAQAIGARLQQLRAKGERVLLLYPQGTEYIAAFYGCIVSGAIAVPAYPPRMNRNLQRLEAILDDAQPKAVLTTDAVLRQMRRRFDESSHLAQLDWLVTSEVPVADAEAWIDPQVNENTIAFLQYTSASTSNPKGVMVSHRNILHNQILMKEAVQHSSETVAVSWLPLFHDMGLISVVLASLYNGFPCHLISPVDVLKRPRVWLEAITRYRGTFSGSPDFGFQLCVDRISEAEREGLDLSTWRVAYNGSEPVRAETLRRFSRIFAPQGFRQEALFSCYGLAEHTLFVSGRFYQGARSFSRESLQQHSPRPAEDAQSVELVSCGMSRLDARLVIADAATGRRCPEGQVGEIWLASPSVAHGYWNQPEASERDFLAHLENGQGPFLRTGDLGFVFDGELYITGRLKDLIIIRGRNLIPQDIEQTVEQCDPAIRPAFVAAVSVEANGAERLVVVAEVRREVRRSVDLNALIDRIRRAVGGEYAVDVSAVLLLRPGSLPKTSSGKTQRAKVRRDFEAGELGSLVQWRDEAVFETPLKTVRAARAWDTLRLENWLVERIAAHAKSPLERIDRDVAISSFGFDSVVAAALVFEIEEAFGVDWDLERLFGSESTVKQLAHRILVETRSPRPNISEAPTPTVPVSDQQVLAAKAVQQPNGGRTPTPEPVAPRHMEQGEYTQPINGRINGKETLPAKPAPVKPTARPFPYAPSRNGQNSPREHPFRTSVNPELACLLTQMGMDKVFVRGEGSWLWDEGGRRYLDFLAQYGALPFGFNPAPIWDALNAVRESGEPSFVQPSYLTAAGELAERLLSAAPRGMAYVTFTNSGAEAIEAAIKLCRSTTGRRNILSASNSFHGKTMGALSASDREKFQKAFGAPEAGFHYVPFGDIDALRRALSTRAYAGFLVEPIQGEGGIVEPPAGYLRSARKACREAGTLFVADEIQTGMGRTGAMFVCCDLGITPDVMTVAKALGGGLLPIGACLSTRAAHNTEFALRHTSTFAGNTLACRAGLATLDLLEANDGALVRQVAENGARLKEGLLALKRRFPRLISEVRGRGYLLGLRFGLDRYSVDEGLLGYLGEQEAFTFLIVGYLLNFEGVRLGCTLNQGGVVRIEPPLTVTWEECSFCLQALEKVLGILERRDVAALTAQITGLRLPDRASVEVSSEVRTTTDTAPPVVRPNSRPQPGDGRFAFLVHPLAWNDYADLEGTLSVLSEEQLATLSSALADNFEPFVVGETRVVGENRKAAYGEFILVPRRAEELKSMAHELAVSEIHQAVSVAQKRGAQIVGLGAYTSVVTQGGLSLSGAGLPALTTGNSYTAIAACESVQMAAAERGWALPTRTVAVLGAGGAIGQALSLLLARVVGRLILLGNPAHPEQSLQGLLQSAGRLIQLQDELRSGAGFSKGSVCSWVEELGLEVPVKPNRAALVTLGQELIRRRGPLTISVDAAALLPEADIVVCCTSTPDRFVSDEYFRPSAVVCDVSRPSNVPAGLTIRRPDVMVLNGGVVRLPGNSLLGINASLEPGYAYACMAETMMLAMSKHYQDTSLGLDLPLAKVLEMSQLAKELNFQVVLDRKIESDREVMGMVGDRPRNVNVSSAYA